MRQSHGRYHGKRWQEANQSIPQIVLIALRSSFENAEVRIPLGDLKLTEREGERERDPFEKSFGKTLFTSFQGATDHRALSSLQTVMTALWVLVRRYFGLAVSKERPTEGEKGRETEKTRKKER